MADAAAGDTKFVGQACKNLGACHYNMGQYAQALPLFEQARAAFAAAGDSAGAARVSGMLADCAARAGRTPRSCLKLVSVPFHLSAVARRELNLKSTLGTKL